MIINGINVTPILLGVLEAVFGAICFALTLVCIVIPEQGLYTYQMKYFLAITVFFLALAAFEIVPAVSTMSSMRTTSLP